MVDVTEFVLDLAQLPVPEPRVTLFSYRNDELRPDLKERLTQALSTLGTLPRRD